MPPLLPVWLCRFILWTKSKKKSYFINILSKSRVCNSTNENLMRVLWPLCPCPACILTLLQVSNHYLENCKNCWDPNPTCHVYEARFISKSWVCNASNRKMIRYLYADAQPICLLCCKFLNITLKTEGGIAETRTLLCHVYKAWV